jgi:hypothetical protein
VPLGDVDPTTQAALAALGTNDWPALYGLLGPTVAASYTQDQFVTMMSSAGLPAFVDATTDGSLRTQSLGGTTFAGR